ncbi:MAG: thiamine pyrophosphate-binding protein [Betaproteobacteria bacterium]
MAGVADLVVRRLRQSGVSTIFGVPGGGGNLDLIEAAGRTGLPFVLTATEAAGVVAAIAQSEITGRPGACLTTLGPGAASAANGVACAMLERAPVLVFTDGYARSSAGRFPHQRLDHAALFASITKASLALDADGADRIVADALCTAAASMPGPVHVDCPADAFGPSTRRGPSTERSVAAPSSAPADRRSRSERRPEAPAGLLACRRPLVIAGLGARRPDAAAAIRRLCESRGIPAMVTYKAKGVVPDDHPWFAGVFTNAAIERPLVERADLLIGIGFDPVELIPRPWTVPAPIVYCGPWPVEDRQVPFAHQEIGDCGEAADRLAAGLSRSDWTGSDVRAAVDEQRRSVSTAGPGFTAQRVVTIVADRLARTCRVAVDAGAHMFPATVLWPVGEPNGMLISNGLSTMGFALPAAIGAAILERGRSVVALTGDGGLLMCLGELATVVRERLRVIVIVFADESLSLIEIKQQARQFAPAGVALGRIDWQQVGRGFGLDVYSAADEGSFERAVEAAAAGRGPCLVEARIDPRNYGATLRAVRG